MANKLEQQIGTWLLKLSNLAREGKDVKVSKKSLQDMAKMLATDFPPEVFTDASLKEVLEASEWFPTYAALKQRLGEWRARNMPAEHDLEDVPLPPEGKRWVAHWRRRVAEAPGSGSLRVVLSLIRERDGEAYEWLVWKDAAAVEIARRYRLQVEATIDSHASAAAADWKDPARVQASVDGLLRDPPAGMADACLALLRVCVGKHAPENLHLVPLAMPRTGVAAAERRVSMRDQLDAIAAPTKPMQQRGLLTPEQLAYARANPGATEMPRVTDR